jgi:anti-sigma factor RsiW
MSACPDRLLLLQALIDGELDAANSIALEAHLRSCEGCTEELHRLEALRSRLSDPALRHQAPQGLRDRVAASLGQEAHESRAAPSPATRRPSRGPWFAGGALTAMAASLALVLALPQFTTVPMQEQLVSSHVRSLLANHLTDVQTSDRHVVKPWFNGRIDFAPPVVELASQGFPLVGGRLDYIGGRVVPAIVYRRRLHTINLFVMPAGRFSSPAPVAARRDGYSLLRWTQGSLQFWAVSDIDPADLELFRRTFEKAAAS